MIYPNITTLIRPFPKMHHAYGIYEREKVLEALGLSTPQHLVLYAVVSSNDYSNNITGLGPGKNSGIIRPIDGNKSAKEMLDEYILAAAAIVKPGVSVDAKMFQPSLRVFALGKQRPIDIPESTSFQSALDRLQEAKAKRAEVVKKKRTTAQQE